MEQPKETARYERVWICAECEIVLSRNDDDERVISECENCGELEARAALLTLDIDR